MRCRGLDPGTGMVGNHAYTSRAPTELPAGQARHSSGGPNGPPAGLGRCRAGRRRRGSGLWTSRRSPGSTRSGGEAQNPEVEPVALVGADDPDVRGAPQGVVPEGDPLTGMDFIE